MPKRLGLHASLSAEIRSSVAEDATPATADRLIDAVIDRFDLLAAQPGIGGARKEFGPGVRFFVVDCIDP